MNTRRPLAALPATLLSAALFALATGGFACTIAKQPTGKASRTVANQPAVKASSTLTADGVYAITFGVAKRSGRLSAVQFEATPSGGGAWRKAGGQVVCRELCGADMHACNDKGGGTLTCALVSLAGIATPSDLIRCELRSSRSVSATDLTIRTVDASDPGASPVDVEVSVTKVNAD